MLAPASNTSTRVQTNPLVQGCTGQLRIILHNLLTLLTLCHILPLLPTALTVPSDTDVTVTCARIGANFPAIFTVSVTVVSGKGKCADSAQMTTTVSSTCCVTGPTYARNAAGATCLNSLGCADNGFINTVPANTPANYSLVYGTCSSFASTGSIPVTCVNTGPATSTVTLGVVNQPFSSGTPARKLYVGCVNPSGGQRCRADRNFGAATCGTTVVRSCGGSLGGAQSIPLTCQCSSVRWIAASIASAPTTFTAERVNGVCLA